MNEASQNSAHQPLTTYLVRTLERPTVVCPAWCVVDPDQHIDELSAYDGGVLHLGRWMSLASHGALEAQLVEVGLVDGRGDPEEDGVQVRLSVDREAVLSLPDALDAAKKLTAMSNRYASTHPARD